MKQKITINDKTYEVEVGDLTSMPVRVTVNGKNYDVVVETTASEPQISKPAAPTASPKPVVAAKPRPAAAAAPMSTDGGNEIRSPMPGTIIGIDVKPGVQVKAGQQVCTLEAMKMKNAIRSPKDGVIASVEVSSGQKVNFGDILIRFE